MEKYIQLEIPFATEEWRDIDGYEGLYQVSDLGRVRSCDSIRITHNQFGEHKGFYKGRILKPRTKKDGYSYAVLCKGCKEKEYKIHRLVAQTFIPNPDNLPCVDHKNTIRNDNRVSNLRWCTYRSNIRDNLITKERVKNASANNGRKRSKRVVQKTLGGVVVKVWPSLNEARRNGFSHCNIWACCNGKRKMAHGYKWEYA